LQDQNENKEQNQLTKSWSVTSREWHIIIIIIIGFVLIALCNTAHTFTNIYKLVHSEVQTQRKYRMKEHGLGIISTKCSPENIVENTIEVALFVVKSRG
jgi:hypothetical protein